MKSSWTNPAVRRLADLIPGGIRNRLARALGLRPQEEPAFEVWQADVEQRLRRAAMAVERDWQAVKTQADWERFRDSRLASLRRSLGPLPPRRSSTEVRATVAREHDGVVVESLRYDGHPGVPVTADLYRPASGCGAQPGILICHGHHCDRSHPELRDIGFLWARVGCTVLIPDLIGHGQRRLHPFDSNEDYRLPFKAHRQDYYFRYNLGLQLDLTGHSLMGWMVGDTLSSFDVLIDRPSVDVERTVLIGSVAGGGDVAAVAAALEPRIACLVSFGYRTRDITIDASGAAAKRIPSAGRGGWESTRSLARSACDGFLPWVVLAARAPRHLIYAHEFSWDPAADAQWRRMQRVYEVYDAAKRLAVTHGSGSVSGPPPLNTHCTNVGSVHRRELHPRLAEWFGIPPPEENAANPPDGVESRGVPSDADRYPVLATALESATRLRANRGAPEIRRLRGKVASLLGIDPAGTETPACIENRGDDLDIVRMRLGEGPELELGILWPTDKPTEPFPAILVACQQGWRAWRQARSKLVDRLRQTGVAVCAFDLCGTGPGDSDRVRGRHGAIAAIASSERMLGRTVLGRRVTELRAALDYLRGREELDAGRLLLWGDSLAAAHPSGANLEVPFDAGPLPRLSEPLGGLAALLGALFEEVRAVYARGLPARIGSLLDSPFLYSPGDAIVPGLLTVAEIDDLVAALAPRALWMEGLVDGLNRLVDAGEIESCLAHARGVYADADPKAHLVLRSRAADPVLLADWVRERL